MKVLTPGQILERLGRSLDLLTSGAHDAPERQRTLRGTVEWSHQLLAADEQRLFAQLAVFAGSFALEAAEAVCSAELDVLQSLVDKSLLRHGEDGRFFMLATIKEFALEKLRDLSDASSLRRRHDDYFLGVAEELDARERLSGMRDLSAESLHPLRAGAAELSRCARRATRGRPARRCAPSRGGPLAVLAEQGAVSRCRRLARKCARRRRDSPAKRARGGTRGCGRNRLLHTRRR